MQKPYLMSGEVRLPGSNGTSKIPTDFAELMLICEQATLDEKIEMDVKLEIAESIAEILIQFKYDSLDYDVVSTVVDTVLDRIQSNGNKELSSKTKRNRGIILSNITNKLTRGKSKP